MCADRSGVEFYFTYQSFSTLGSTLHRLYWVDGITVLRVQIQMASELIVKLDEPSVFQIGKRLNTLAFVFIEPKI